LLEISITLEEINKNSVILVLVNNELWLFTVDNSPNLHILLLKLGKVNFIEVVFIILRFWFIEFGYFIFTLTVNLTVFEHHTFFNDVFHKVVINDQIFSLLFS
jgi:hypothetical protein